MGRPKKNTQTVTLTLEELNKLLKNQNAEEKEPVYTYVNYATYPVSVLSKNFEPNGTLGDSRKDITESDLFLIKKAGFITNGLLGEKSEEPKDGSYSNTMLLEISKLEFDKFTNTVDRIFGIVTMNRLLKYVQNNDSAKYEKYCLNRINDLEKMENEGSEHVPTNIAKDEPVIGRSGYSDHVPTNINTSGV